MNTIQGLKLISSIGFPIEWFNTNRKLVNSFLISLVFIAKNFRKSIMDQQLIVMILLTSRQVKVRPSQKRKGERGLV